MRKLNLGSGPNSVKGWINYDWGLLPFLGKFGLTTILIKFGLLDKSYDWKWPEIKFVDLRGELPDGDNSVDYIYCSNVLEHFEKYESTAILKECWKVLKKGGMIRVVLPDLNKLIENYTTADNFNLEYFGYNKDQYNGFIGRFKRLFIRGHQWMYDKNSFKALLKEVGFLNINEQKFRTGEVPNLDKLDLEMHKKLCFYYECKK